MAQRLLALAVLLSAAAAAEPIAAPGDMRLRNDLQLLNDNGVINVSMTAWPISLRDVHNAIQMGDVAALSVSERAAFERVRNHLSWELKSGTVRYRAGLAGAYNPGVVRRFEGTPREEGEASIGLNWLGERFALNSRYR